MKKKSFGRSLLAGLLSIVSGCSMLDKDFRPDSYRIGVVVRPVEGKGWGMFEDKKDIVLFRAQINKELNKSFDFYLNGDIASGKLDLSPRYLDDGETSGSLTALGTGISYYPFESRNFSLDLGIQVFSATNVKIKGRLGPIETHFHDEVFGWGAVIGASYKIPIDENWGIIFSGGYNLTDNVNKNHAGNYDFDGLYLFGGIEFKIRR